MAEGVSAAGVPVFVPDIKGDLSGIGMSGLQAGCRGVGRLQGIGLGLCFRESYNFV